MDYKKRYDEAANVLMQTEEGKELIKEYKDLQKEYDEVMELDLSHESKMCMVAPIEDEMVQVGDKIYSYLESKGIIDANDLSVDELVFGLTL